MAIEVFENSKEQSPHAREVWADEPLENISCPRYSGNFNWLSKMETIEHGGTPSMPTLRRQKQVDLCVFKASLVYILSSRTARVI